MKCYENECERIRYLSVKQLNLPKNVAKENFENVELKKIILKLYEEVRELEIELLRPHINYINLYGELGDVAGVLAGLLAHADSLR